MSTTALLRVYLFGTFRLYRNGYAVSPGDWHTRQARQLFKLLLAERGRPVAASRLMGLLWPEHSEHAHQTLRSAISALRDVLEPGRDPRLPSRFIPRGHNGYRLVIPADCELWIDVDEFEGLLEHALHDEEATSARATLGTALQLYCGDYLAEDGDAPWLLAERKRLRERYVVGVQRLMALECAAGAHAEAIALGWRALTFDRCCEPLYRLIMQAQLQLGNRSGALQTFVECRQALRSLLGVDPAPETLALHAAILQDQNQRVQPVSPVHPLPLDERASAAAGGRPPASARASAPFIGRQNELEHLLDWLESYEQQAGSNQRARLPSVMALVGEAGVGKTSLGRLFLRRARARGFTILSATCQALEREMAFAPVVALLKTWLSLVDDGQLTRLVRQSRQTLERLLPLLPALGRRLPELAPPAPTSPEQDYSLLVAALVDLFCALCEERPLLLGCDDLQWADDSSLLLLHHLAQRSRASSAAPLLLIAYRPEDLSENPRLSQMIHHLGRASLLVTLPLQRFTPAEVAAYLQACQASPPLSAEQLYQATQGNALFLREAVQALHSLQEQGEARPPASDREVILASLLRSRQIRDVILARVERLPPAAAAFLALAATIARPFPPRLLAQELTPADQEALELLVERGFLVEGTTEESGVTLALSHEVLGQVVYSACSALRRANLHRQAALALERTYAARLEPHAAALAYHYSRAGDDCDPLTLRYALLAADYACRTFSYQQALAHYEMALRLVQRMRERGLSQEESEDWLRRIYEGRLLVYEIMLDWEGLQISHQQLSAWAQARQDLSLIEDSAGRLIVSRSLMGYLNEALEMGQALIARLQAESRTVAHMAEETRRRLRLLEDTTRRWALLLTLDDVPPSRRRAKARHSAGYPAFFPAPPPVVQDWGQVSLLLGSGPAASTLTTYGWALLLQGRNSDAARCLAAAMQAGESSGQVASWILAAMHLSRVHYLRGAYEESERQMSACLERCRQVPEAAWAAVWPLLNLAYARVVNGRLEEAEQLLLQVQRRLEEIDLPAYRYSTQVGLGLVALARGQLTEAEELLRSALAQRQALYIEVYVLAHLALGDIARLRGACDEAYTHYRQMLAFCGERSLLQLYCAAATALGRLHLSWRQATAPAAISVRGLLAEARRYAQGAGYVDIARDCQRLLSAYHDG
jgi:DNA-binding SARP family transcriptional activator